MTAPLVRHLLSAMSSSALCTTIGGARTMSWSPLPLLPPVAPTDAVFTTCSPSHVIRRKRRYSLRRSDGIIVTRVPLA
eukprot:CAMPEP_0167801772 /NCGR_PEP_ID=MMETSP0111_2-20121227/18672_1 /TAXON_ID=91324 /ORGANISM="Lotharella globosa, Strain CCCM811" /LENGTH=77 /DNA_ID=CAMNT_0007697579 /DNA_START=191 /DNA_END=424 /DNA_ORIENTATION=-